MRAVICLENVDFEDREESSIAMNTSSRTFMLFSDSGRFWTPLVAFQGAGSRSGQESCEEFRRSPTSSPSSPYGADSRASPNSACWRAKSPENWYKLSVSFVISDLNSSSSNLN